MKNLHSVRLNSFASVLASAILVLLAGCGASSLVNGGTGTGTSTGTTTTAPAPVVTITAAPASITAGATSILTVVATSATGVTVTGTDGTTYALAATGGTQKVTPAKSTTYTASATGAGGTTTATVLLTVAAPSGSPTVTITAAPTTITAGASSTLTVAATGATSVTVAGTDGSNYTLAGTGGTQMVTPAVTTIYTATAIGSGATVTAKATVTVTTGVATAPTVSITATPATINAGSNSTLTVAATNATTVSIAGTDGSAYTLAPLGGTQSVAPLATTIYTVTANGAGGTATALATVTVVPAPAPVAPTVTLSAAPTTITLGASTTLSVMAMNATTVVLTGADGSSVELPPAGGTETVSPTTTSTYSVTANGAGGTITATVLVTVNPLPGPTVTITANPASIAAGSHSTLAIVATQATSVVVTGTDGSSYTLAKTGGTQSVTPTATTTYSVTADGAANTTPATASAIVTVTAAGNVNAVNHVIFMLQENHTFDNYFGMLNPYRKSNNFAMGDDGNEYDVDGINDKLTTLSNTDKSGNRHSLYKFKSTCIDDASSAWTESYGNESLGNFLTTRPINVNGFVSNADGFASNCFLTQKCSGQFTDLSGDRAMGYYDQGFLNYYYYMASQFALSDRWFSPMSSKSIPNRIATFTGGTTQGLTQDPSSDDKLQQLSISNIFQELDQAHVSWRVYYTVNNGLCIDPEDCNKTGSALYPATTFSYLTYSYKYVNGQKPCTGTTVPSSVIGDASNSFCIDPNHIAPLSQYFTDVANGNLPSFTFIEAGYGNNDEHPGSGQSILAGQAQVAHVVNSLMTSPSWKDSVFFLSYDEGGGPYDHVPPVPGHSNDKTTKAVLGNYPVDIGSISVSPDAYKPCVPANDTGTPTLHCDLRAGYPGANSGDAAAVNGFGAQLGFRVPNMVISPFVRKHYVSHVPMDHTAVIKFVENRFIGPSAHLTARDAAQSNLLDFFDFNNTPWATPPTPPAPVTAGTLGYDPCTPGTLK